MERIGVFLCHCFLSPLSATAAKDLIKALSSYPGVVHIAQYQDMCMEPDLEQISNVIKDEKLDGVILTGCSTALHEAAFKKLTASSGLSSHQVAVIDLKKQVDLSSGNGYGLAAEKAAKIIQTSIDKLRSAQVTEQEKATIIKKALVIGGGISGIYAALDIADGGYEVYLVEKNSTIGGHMLQYSEVFPTLDCPQCIGTPKMVEVGQHSNINLWAYSEVEKISGEVGNFKVTIKRKTPYVDWDNCTGCAECSNVCPMELTGRWDAGVAPEKAITRAFAQAVPNKVVLTNRGAPPCRAACPAGVNVQGYVALVSLGKFKEAVEMVKETNPFPAVCGRVCVHPCEQACNRGQFDDPIAIRALKRCAVEYALTQTEEDTPEETGFGEVKAEAESAPEIIGEKVAVVGAGPAGLTAAYFLARMGHKPTVLEALPEPGGMMRVGIPAYRLPREILKAEIGDIVKLGAEIRTNTRVESIDELFSEGFKAVFLALGAHKGIKLGIEGEDSPGVVDCVTFLRDVSLGRDVKVGEEVAVIGGGNAAIDAARTSLRLGAKEVTIFYRRTRKEMPAAPEEVEDALREGVNIIFLAAPSRISVNGDKLDLECIRMELGERDASGRRRPVPVEGSEFAMSFDTVIPAIGQQPEVPAGLGIKTGRGKTIKVDPITYTTEREGVFAGGDLVLGPASVVEAIAHGHQAAIFIDLYLQGEDLKQVQEKEEEKIAETPGRIPLSEERRQPIPTLKPDEAIRSFDEFEQLMDREVAIAEAGRCLSCGGCAECRTCIEVCEKNAIDYQMEDIYVDIEVGAIVVATGFDLMPKSEIREFIDDPDVIDGFQFERILCPSGPTAGAVKRISDGKEPKEVVLVSCVGSRDPEHGVSYCSRVCCMYLAKQALLYKHVVHDGQAYIFYMDQRTTGKGYEEFVQRAVEEYGVMYLRGRVSKIFREGDKLRVLGADTLTGKKVDIPCDLVVLGMAMMPSEGTRELARKLGIATNESGFIAEAHPKFRPLETSVPGIYVAGTAQGPRDIPDSVAMGCGAASKVLELFSKDSVEIEILLVASNQ
jgi:heterodisulfide reductase subunit A